MKLSTLIYLYTFFLFLHVNVYFKFLVCLFFVVVVFCCCCFLTNICNSLPVLG